MVWGFVVIVDIVIHREINSKASERSGTSDGCFPCPFTPTVHLTMLRSRGFLKKGVGCCSARSTGAFSQRGRQYSHFPMAVSDTIPYPETSGSRALWILRQHRTPTRTQDTYR